MWSNIYLLGTVSFLTDISSEMIKAVLPALLAAMGAGGLAIGMVGNLPHLFEGITHYLSGSLSDKTGKRKHLIFAGYLMSCLSKLLIVVSPTSAAVAASRSGERIGKGLRIAPRDSLICDTVPQEYAGKAFGIQKAMDSAGALVGTLAAYILWQTGCGIKTIIFAGASISFIALPLILALREKFIPEKTGEAKSGEKKLNSVFIYTGLFSLANINYLFFISFIQLTRGNTGAAVSSGIFAYILYNAAYAVFAVPAGKFASLNGCRKGLILANILFIILCALFIFIPGSYLTASMLLLGITAAFSKVSIKTWVNELTPSAKRGRNMGKLQITQAFSLLGGGIAQGILWNINHIYTFALGAVAGTLALGFLFTVKEN
ncbi:MAG: MFS transporter [Elusimicrobiota bacterium]|nr:MFS transporter [Elusimicrobiota bacterium]